MTNNDSTPTNDWFLGKTLAFYGRLAGATQRDVERLARERGAKVASTLRETVDRVVLGEGEPLAQTRARLAAEFDERSRLAFERGTLELVAESDFFRRLEESRRAETFAETKRNVPSGAPSNALRDGPSRDFGNSTNDSFAGYTPAAVAELVGVSIQTIRRWTRRGLLAAANSSVRLPSFSTREILVAKRLAFLCSTGLSEEFVEKRVAAFRAFATTDDGSDKKSENNGENSANNPPDVASIVLRSTLSSDGRDLLFDGDAGPVDRRGQRRFDFNALPTDGALETPPPPPFLSDAEEKIALAEQIAAWNVAANAVSNENDALKPPAFLALFPNETSVDDEPSPVPQTDRFDFYASPFSDADAPNPTIDLSDAARERWRDASNRNVVRLCENAWNLEREGYWEEAARVYRSAALAGGLDAGVSFRLGKILYLLGDFAAARERFYVALELDDDYVEARLELAKTFVALGEFDDALAAFQGALENRPDDPAIRLELGKLYLRLGRRVEAEDEFRFAVARLDDSQLADDARRLLLAFAKNEI